MQSQHDGLAAGVVTTVSIGADPVDKFKGTSVIEVLNRDGVAEIYFTTDGSTPTVGGANTYILPATIGQLKVDVTGDGPVTVKMISSGIPKYSVTAS